ncbi:sulfite exporter TauE/SafE family protein [Cupriavidus basilensis]|uniref:Sulfite exporter TauE/SafE family protein n=1 Tax=Cupriavidus basilensis TaxID=68895 RepID=A0ABT6B5Q7_9BURK|nr:sulfite exporter TauE/SafE family protein [Cupriavidus basilensis]MDF3839847.1 sulfite exporter TauE/SafE family protein [Cupriavidus basilensis]
MTIGVLFSVFTLALLGGVHCAAMCGGIALAAEQGGVARVPATILRRPGHWLLELLVMHAGRLSMYAVLGALLGALGAGVWKAQYLPLQRWLFGIGSVMLVLSGLWMLRGRSVGAAWLERLAARGAGGLLRGVSGVAARLPAAALPQGRLLRRYGMGLAWGLVPCGMVYGALAMALLAGNAPSGALVMSVFGLGTLPNLLVISGLSGYLRQLSRRPVVRTGAGLAVAAFGVAGVARALLLPESLAAHGFCLVF